jgi:membrane-associated progesterone receptor component
MWGLLPEHVAAQQLLELHQLANVGTAAPTPQPPEVAPEQLVDSSLQELDCFRGVDGGRIMLSFEGKVFDVSTARDLFGPCGQYVALAGTDVTRCLGEMCLDDECLGDLNWDPDNSEEQRQLGEWRRLLTARYPVAGSLRGWRQRAASEESDDSQERGTVSRVRTPPVAKTIAGGAHPISLTAASTGQAKRPATPQSPAPGSPVKATSGFMAGKSLIAIVEKQRSEKSLGGGSSDSMMLKLCPLHGDEATIKLVAVTAAISCVGGAVIGWSLRGRMRP